MQNTLCAKRTFKISFAVFTCFAIILGGVNRSNQVPDFLSPFSVK